MKKILILLISAFMSVIGHAQQSQIYAKRIIGTEAFIFESPAVGSTADSILVWNPADKSFYVIPIDSLNAAGYWQKSGNYIYTITDSVGIGTATPTDQFEVINTASVGQLRIPKFLDGTSQQIDYTVNWSSADSLTYPFKIKRESIDSLRAMTSIVPYVFVGGYYADGDGAHGNFWWDGSSTEPDDSAMVIKLTSVTTGRYKRIYSNEINPKWFGAKGDSVYNDTKETQAAVNFASKKYYLISGYARYGNIVLFPPGEYMLDSLILREGVRLVGTDQSTTILHKNYGSDPNYFITTDTVSTNYYTSIERLSLVNRNSG